MTPDQALGYALEHSSSADEEILADSSQPVERPQEEDVGGSRRHNLPVAQGGFVGRERVMEEVKNTLSRTQLLTLTGAGGCGKTRLALEVARDVVDDYPDGVWLVQLASLTQGDLVPDAVAAALGLRKRPDLSFTESLVEFLHSRHVLLVIDNCEHLIEASARLVGTLLSSCENLCVLATSREALGVVGEINWMVPSLTVPEAGQVLDPENLARYESVELFVNSARSRLPGFALTTENALAIVEICRKLDGIPLAIELATARMGALSAEQIAERLDDALGLLTTGDRTRAPCYRTLRAALEWGYDLLSESERELFGRLSVFAGGWTLSAAETVGDGGSVEAREVLDLLSALVDKSLVVAEDSSSEAEGPRYRMLEPVRQCAAELLEDGGAAEETRSLHAAFYLGMAEEARPHLVAARQVDWLGRLEREMDNLRAALSWAISAEEMMMAAWLGWTLYVFWSSHSRQNEGRRWMEPIFLRRNELPPWLRIRTIITYGTMVYALGEVEFLEQASRELLEVSQAIGGDALGEGYAHVGFGVVAMHRDDFEAAREHLEKALLLFREVGEDGGTLPPMHFYLGMVLRLEGDYEGARRNFEEALALGRSTGSRVNIYIALFNLAQLALARGDYDDAFRWFAEGIVPSQEIGDSNNIAYILEGLGMVAGARGEAGRAARLLGASGALITAIGLRGHPFYQFDRALHERINAGVRSTMGAEAYETALEEGRSMTQEQAIEYALGMVETKPVEAPSTVDSLPETPSTGKQVQTLEAETTVGLRIFALGAARVEKEGQPLASSPDWIQKPRELLYYLLSHPQGRTKEQIGLALWPDASTSQLRSSFHDTVFRLRRALGGKEWISFAKGRYDFERSLPYAFDAEAFEKNLAQARRLRSQSPDEAIGHLQKAVGLYGGDFLEDLPGGEWAYERQDELRREYQDALMLLGRMLFTRERHAEAAESYRKAIAQDEFMEEAHRELMRSQAALGERGRALRHYEDLAGLLEDRLGTSPAPETTALYERLRAGAEI